MIKGLYGFTSACALVTTIALIPEYVGIIPGFMIFLCGGLFTFLITKIIEEEQKSGGESPQDLWHMNVFNNKLTIRMTKDCLKSFGKSRFVDNVEIKIDPDEELDPGPGQIPVYLVARKCQSSQIYFIRWVSPNLNKKARLKHRVFFFGRAGSQVTDQVASAGSYFWVQALMIYINIKCCFVCKSCYNV